MPVLESLKVSLILTHFFTSNDPLYFTDNQPPYRDTGVRLEIKKELPKNFFFELKPYIWSSGLKSENGGDLSGDGGAEMKLGWRGDHFGVWFYHHSRHRFDGPLPGNRRHLELDGIEVEWILQ